MRRRKELPKYNADQLNELKSALTRHCADLVSAIQVKANGMNPADLADDVWELRDMVSQLCRTSTSLEHVDVVIRIADHGEPQSILSLALEDCGMTWGVTP